MISFMFQGFLILLIAFLLGLPVGDLIARLMRRWCRQPRPETERVQTMMAGPTPGPDPSIPHSTLSMPERRDSDTHAPPAEPFISPSLLPPAQ